MPEPSLTIHSPCPSQVVHACQYKDKDTGKAAFFAFACVDAHGIDQVGACLVDPETLTSYGGVRLKESGRRHKHWIFGFPRLPAKQADYHLVVAQVGAPNETASHSATVSFTLDKPTPAKVKANPGISIPIQNPASNSVQGRSFSAYGSLVGGHATTGASMTNTANQTFNGVPLSGVPSGMWAYAFNNVSDGHDYTFKVADNSGDSGQNTGITVEH
jgi:hypothetical protein